MRALLLLLALFTSSVAAKPGALVFCHEDQDSYPWVLRDRAGLNIVMLRLLERDIGMPIRFLPLPWRRCLAELAANNVDGAFAASFKAERLSMGRYPSGKDGKPDPARRLHMSSYSLYRAKGNALRWNGSRFDGLQGQIGTLTSHSIIDFLLERGVAVDSGSKSPVETLRKVALGRLQGAALQTPRAEHVLAQMPELARQLEREPVLLEERAYYLMLSNRLVDSEPQLADTVWRQIERIRDSAPYKQAELDFFGAN